MDKVRYRAKKAKKIIGSTSMKIVRVDDKTQIEVPVHISDKIAIERFLLRRNIGPRPLLIVPKADEEELIIPEDISELGDEPEQEESEEGE